MVLGLLDQDRDVARGQIEAARVILFDHLGHLGSGALSIEDHARSEKLVEAVLTRTFERILLAIKAQYGNGSPAEPGHSN